MTVIYISFLYFGLSAVFELSAFWIVNTLSMGTIMIIFVDIVINSFLLVVCILIYRGKFLSSIVGQISLIKKSIKLFLLLSIWLSMLFVSLLSDFFSIYELTPYVMAIELLSALLIIIVGILCPLLVVNNLSSAYYKTVSDSMEQLVDTQVKHLELMIKANKEITIFRHDFKNLKIALLHFLNEGNIPKALEYLQDFGLPFDTDYILFETGNRVADALLTEKQENAKKMNSEVFFTGNIPSFEIKPADICIILGNAMDNALEACEKLAGPDKCVIEVSAYTVNNFFFLKITNPIPDNVTIINNTVPTSKKDKKNHGIGLSSINNIAEKYSGYIKVYTQDSKFVLEVILELQNDK
jgi:hypothetical protein